MVPEQVESKSNHDVLINPNRLDFAFIFTGRADLKHSDLPAVGKVVVFGKRPSDQFFVVNYKNFFLGHRE